MTPIIRSTNPQRRRLIGRGTLPESDTLLPPAAVFTGEQAELQVQDALDAEAQGLDEEYDDTPITAVVDIDKQNREEKVVRKLTRNSVTLKKPSKVEIIVEDDDEEEGKEALPTEPVPSKKFKARKVGVNPIEDIMNAMRSGEAIMVKREGVNSYQVSVVPNDIIVSKTGFKYLKKGITGRQYWEEVLNPEFAIWSKKWNSMTYTEKVAYATKLGVAWRHTDNERMDVMLMSEAVRKAEHIDKYKPEYMKRSARAKVRG